MLHELVPDGGESLIPAWEVPGWAVLLNLSLLGGVTEERRLRLGDLCRMRPDHKRWSAVEESKRVGSGEIMTTLKGVRSCMFGEEPKADRVGILRETWSEVAEGGWAGLVEWLPGRFVQERSSSGWTKFLEAGDTAGLDSFLISGAGAKSTAID